MRLRLCMNVMPPIPDTFKKYECPYCKHILYDKNEKLFDRLQNSPYSFLIYTCPECKQKYGIIFDYKDNLLTFRNPKKDHVKLSYNEVYQIYFNDLCNYDYVMNLDKYL